MAEIYVTNCQICAKHMTTRRALEKHYNQKHPCCDTPQSIVFPNLGSKQAPVEKPQLLTGMGILEMAGRNHGVFKLCS